MSITPIMSLPAIPAPWTIPMRRTTPVEDVVSGVQQVRAMLADQAGVPMLERKPEKTEPQVRPTASVRAGDGAKSASYRRTTERGTAMRLPPEGIAL